MKNRIIVFIAVQLIALLISTAQAYTEDQSFRMIYKGKYLSTSDERVNVSWNSEDQGSLKETPLSIDKTGNELQTAKETLIEFFNYLHGGQYDKAVLLFEPWEKGVGRQRSNWEGISSILPPAERSDKGKALGAYYRSVGVPIRAKVLDIKKVADNEYKLKIQFLKDDGSIYVYGPCCGATEKEMPSETEFDYFVQGIKGIYKVRTPPLFRP
ncbi:MAG: hypothetical protein M0Z67_18930 [Nitrospiraceae bacterium]|nr:hypothetical protein [Nitrospiraceae bacterium]